MKNSEFMNNLAIASCALAASLFPIVISSAFAQTSDPKHITILADHWRTDRAGTAFSPDGTSLIYPAPQGQGGGFYLSDASGKTSEPMKLTDDKGSPVTDEFSNIAFSHDGKKLVFESLTGAGGVANLFVSDADGSNVKTLDPPDPDGKYHYGFSGPASFSPDDKKLLVEVRAGLDHQSEPIGDSPFVRIPDDYYLAVGDLSLPTRTFTSVVATPPSKTYFWSTDGQAVFHTEVTGGTLSRLDLASKAESSTNKTSRILGRVPGQNAVFVIKKTEDKPDTVQAISLDSQSEDALTVDAAKDIAAVDQTGTKLKEITPVGGGKVILGYSDQQPKPYAPAKHSVLAEWPNQ